MRRSRSIRRRSLVILGAAAGTFPAGPLSAATDNYTGATNTSWDTATNWSLGAEPTAADDAIFPTAVPASGATITLTAGELANSLTFRNTYTLTGGNLTLTSPGNVTVASTFNATINSVLAGSSGLTLAASNGLAGGDAQAGGGTLTLGGTNTFTGITTISSGVLAINADANLGTAPASAVANQLTLDGGTLRSVATIAIALPKNRGITLTANGGTIQNNSGVELRTNGVIAGSGTLTLVASGAGNTVIDNGTNATGTGLNTYSGGTIIAPGGAGAVIPIQSSTGTANNPTSGPFGIGTITFNGGLFRPTSVSAITLHNRVTLAADTTIVTGGAALSFLGNVTLSGGTRTITQSSANTVTFSGVISDGGNALGLTKAGTGVLIDSGANTYTGTTTVTGGVLRANDGVGLPAASLLTLNGGSIEVGTNFSRSLGSAAGNVQLTGGTSGFSASAAATVNLGGAAAQVAWGGTNFNPSALILNDTTAAAALTFSNPLDLNNTASTVTRTINTAANTATVSGVLSNSAGTANLTKSGAGTLVLSNAANTYSGATTFAGGTLSVATLTNGGVASPLGTSSSAAANLVFNGGNLQYTGATFTLTRDFTLGAGGGGFDASNGTNVLTVSGNATVTPTTGTQSFVLTGTGTGNNTLNTVIANGTGTNVTSLTKNGAGTWVVAGANTYTGATTVNGGVLTTPTLANAGAASGIGAASTAAANLVLNAATLRYTGGNASTDRGMTLTGAAAIDLTGTGTVTVGGVVTGAGALTKTGTNATLALTGTNTFTGAVAISSGGLRITNSSGLGTGTKTITIIPTANPTSLPGLQLDGSGGNITLPSTISYITSFDALNGTAPIAGQGAIVNVAGNNTVAGAFNLTSGGGGTTFLSNAGTLTISGNITPSATLRSVVLRGDGNGVVSGVIANGTTAALPVNRDLGAGIWTLSGANSYSGGTSITSGTLYANAPIVGTTTSATGTGAVTVSTAGTLGGIGGVLGAVTVNPGGAVNPGNSVGTLTIAGPVTFGATGTGTAPTYTAELQPAASPVAGTDNDLLALSGTGANGLLTLSNPDRLNLVALNAVTSQTTYTVATFAAETGVFDTVLVNGVATQNSNPAAANYALVTYNPNNIQVTVNNLQAVPEPASLGLLTLGGLGLLARRRRRA